MYIYVGQNLFFFFADLSRLYSNIYSKGFPGSSAGKESACNAGDPGLIPGSGRSPGEGLGYPSRIHGLPWWLRW